MTDSITGTFDVTMTPRSPHGGELDAGVRRTSLDERYHGDVKA